MKIPDYHGHALAKLVRVTEEESEKALWMWGPHVATHDSYINSIDLLIASGYQQVPRDSGNFLMSHLLSTMADIAVVQNDDASAVMWALSSDIEHARRYPVTLACELEDDAPGTDTGHIEMLQLLPLPRVGEFALVASNGHLIHYHISQLPFEAQTLQTEMGKKLIDLARPGAWAIHNDFHAMSTREIGYQHLATDLRTNILQNVSRKEAKQALKMLENAHKDIANLRQSWLKKDWLDQWREIKLMMQNLAVAYATYHNAQQPAHRQHKPVPGITSGDHTKMPGGNAFRGLQQSFGPGLQQSLWNTESSTEMQLITPNNSLLSVRGENDQERRALYQYIGDEIGVEGLKHMVVLLHAYHAQTGGRERKSDAIVTPRQLLDLLGYNASKVDDKDEQRKIVQTILYLSRTWITSQETSYERAAGRGRRQKKNVEYTPLIVLEALKPSKDGGLEIPRTIEFHLGKEFYDMLFGERMQYYMLPTAQIIAYHGKNQQQEICLAFYLSNYITFNAGRYSVHFPMMTEGAGIRLSEDINKGDHRTRDALRVLQALEQLQKDGWFTRDAHEHIDMALAADFYLAGQGAREADYSPETLKRIKQTYAYLRALTPLELRRKRRENLQHLLGTFTDNAVTFKAGSLLREQSEKLQDARKTAKEASERTRAARAIKAAKAHSKQIAKGQGTIL